MSEQRTYRLTDGRRVTVQDVANMIGGSREAARSRLRKHRDPGVVLAPVKDQLRRHGNEKRYTLDDGTTGTASEFMQRVPGIARTTMLDRLKRSSDPAVVLAPKGDLIGKAWRTTHRLQLPNTPDWSGVDV